MIKELTEEKVNKSKKQLGKFLIQLLLVVAKKNNLSKKAHKPIQAYMSKFKPESYDYVKRGLKTLVKKSCLYLKGKSIGLTELGFKISISEINKRRSK